MTLISGSRTSTTLWYDRPGDLRHWKSDALPLGNGKLGCMVFGRTDKEKIQFNEDTLWIGDEDVTGAYQNFGDIFIEFNHAKTQDYRRELDLSKAVQKISYTYNGAHYKRAMFISYPAKVMVFHFSADKPGAYNNVKILLQDAHKAKTTVENGNTLVVVGNLKGFGYKKEKSYKLYLDYEARLKVLVKNGKLTPGEDGSLTVNGADEFTIILAAGTNYIQSPEKGWKGESPHKRLIANITAASKKPVKTLLLEHVKDYSALFNRLSLDLGKTDPKIAALPTNQRIALYKKGGKDPELEVMQFQMGRFFIICASRYGMPSNLQGIWNDSNTPPWRCDFHSDVNIEMNYWPVDVANLSDCYDPMINWVMSIRKNRLRKTAKSQKKKGWITQGENGAFAGSSWKWSKGDAAWLAQCLWSHYLFTLDKEFLKTKLYPMMKELCDFWIDDLKALPNGKLVSPNGFSPEHGPHEDGVSFDQQLVWDLFDNFLKASAILGVHDDYTAKIADMQKKLLGPQIGKWGQLQEWMVDRDDPKDHHRHISHLIALHPGHQISPITTPKFAEAAKISLKARGDKAKGWSITWRCNQWARLLDGEHAYLFIREFIATSVFNNLFGFYWPFQIDCNFGYTAAVCEMLIQSHMGFIQILPALPPEWADGYVKGIKARGAFVLNIYWKNGDLVKADVLSQKGAPFKLYMDKKYIVESNGKRVPMKKIGKNIAGFATAAGKKYTIRIAK